MAKHVVCCFVVFAVTISSMPFALLLPAAGPGAGTRNALEPSKYYLQLFITAPQLHVTFPFLNNHAGFLINTEVQQASALYILDTINLVRMRNVIIIHVQIITNLNAIGSDQITTTYLYVFFIHICT